MHFDCQNSKVRLSHIDFSFKALSLNWDNQLSKVKGKMSGGLRSLKKLKNLIPQSQLDHVYRALVESNLRYANVIWGSLHFILFISFLFI